MTAFARAYWRQITADPWHCPIEALDATYEDADGRLPHEPGYTDPYLTRRSHMAVADRLTQGRRALILRRLTEGPANTRELEALCEVPRKRLSMLLHELEQENMICTVSPGTRSGPAVYALDSDPSQEIESELGESTLKEDQRNRAAGINPEPDGEDEEDEEDEPDHPVLGEDSPSEQAALREWEDSQGATVRERYIAYLLECEPTRLLALLEQGRIDPSGKILDELEKVWFPDEADE